LLRLAQLVNEILDASRVHQGRLPLHLELGDLATVLETAVENQRLLASERTIHLELPAARPVLVRLDPDRIGQVVTNYLSNALKYSSQECPVVVRLQVEGAWGARVSVRDEGVGVPLAAQAHIWERFYRVEEVSVQSGSRIGLGIGLHICQAIIAAHQGQVGVDSAVEHGSTFWFQLPLAAEAGVTAHAGA
jgi:signal transduction histidine kinase